MLAEGVANDWSALQVKEDLGVSNAVAALSFGAFSAMMTVGRFTADRISAAVGPVAVVRYGALLSSVGMLTVVVSGWLPLTLLGWALFGAGLSGCIPQIFTTAGNLAQVRPVPTCLASSAWDTSDSSPGRQPSGGSPSLCLSPQQC